MDYLPVKDIDFSSPRSKKRDIIVSNTSSQGERSVNEVSKVMKVPSTEEMNIFYKKISESATKPGALSLVKEYSSSFVPTTLLPKYPQP